jgi:cell division protein FtsX
MAPGRRSTGRAALVVLVVLAVACSSGDVVITADDETISVEREDEFVVELPDDPDDGRRWYAVIDPDEIEAVAARLRTVPGVRAIATGTENGGERWVYADLEVFVEVDRQDLVPAIETAIRDDRSVRALHFIDQAEQYELFREFFRDQPEYLRNATLEDLPTSFRVSLDGSIALRAEGGVKGTRRFTFVARRRDTLSLTLLYCSEGATRTDFPTEEERFRVQVT